METINQKTARLTQMLMKERQQTPDIMQRVAAHCFYAHGKKLTEYLSNGSAEADKHGFLDALITIIEQRQLQFLEGTVPTGQTKSAPEKVAKVTPPAPPAPPAEEPAEQEAPYKADGSDLPNPNEEEEELIKTVPLTKETRIKLDIPANKPPVSNAGQLLAAALAAFAPQKAAAKGLSEADVERIVDERVNLKLAEVFATIAQVLGNSK